MMIRTELFMAPFGKKRFDKMFEGYGQRTYTDKKGMEKTTYVYVGNYFVPRLSDKQFLVRKFLYIALFIASGALQVVAGLQDVPINLMIFVAAIQGLAIILMIIVAIYIGSYLCTPKNMEINTHRNAHEKLTISSMICWLSLLALVISLIVAIFIATGIGEPLSFRLILVPILDLLAGGAIFALWFIEKKTDYDIVSNDTY